MATSSYFLNKDPNTYSFAASAGNDVFVFDDNKLFFASILKDLSSATDSTDFIYFAGWWTDIDLPLGDPQAQPTPPTLKETLSTLATGDPGPQVCCMVWDSWSQKIDWNYLWTGRFLTSISVLLSPSIFGSTPGKVINAKCTKFVTGLSARSKGILDDATRSFGCHHQKIVVIRNKGGLVAYVGSSDFNRDRLFATGKGAPLNDVNIRIVGQGAADILKTFIDRWIVHEEGKSLKLIGADYSPPAGGQGAGVKIQVTHTYGKGYPQLKNSANADGISTAKAAQLQLLRAAETYIYYEDQYMIGNDDLSKALEAKLEEKVISHQEFAVIAVMSPAVISDLCSVSNRRSDFWLPLFTRFGPSRVMLFEMLNDSGSNTGPGSYLHNKMTIVDDRVATIGSLNFSNRSWTHDSEIIVSFAGTDGAVTISQGDTGDDADNNIVRRVRMMRWSRHLGRAAEVVSKLPDALGLWRSIPPTARVKPWTPPVNPLRPVEPMGGLVDPEGSDQMLSDYLLTYSTVLDPA